MVKTYDIKLPLLVFISFFLHVMIYLFIVMPNYSRVRGSGEALTRSTWEGGRDIIVNINPDNQRIINENTLLSDVDSSAKGYITLTPGDRWLNNSLDFDMQRGSRSTGRSGIRYPLKVNNIILNSDSDVAMFLKPYEPGGEPGDYWSNGRLRIPDKDGVSLKNSIFYSNNGLFSFNTVKFKNFKYFKEMKDKIASNWVLPSMANIAFGSYNPVTGAYSTARGYERYMAIPSQKVKIFFTMNRKGDVTQIILLDSLGNRELDNSCIESIRMSVNFGPVPDDIKGEVVGIPFIFGYYAY